MSALPPPVCVALLLADSVTSDSVTGKLTIHGTFSEIRAVSMPIPVAFSVYAALTDGHGSQEMIVRVADLEDEERVIFEARRPLAFADPRATAELILFFQQVTFDHAGDYRVQLFAEQHFLAERRVIVSLPLSSN